MAPIEYLRAVRRHAWVVILAVIVALATGFVVTKPDQSSGGGARFATKILLLGTGTFSQQGLRAGQTENGPIAGVIALAETGEVARRVDAKLNLPGTSEEVGRNIRLAITPRSGLLEVNAQAETATASQELARTFVSELVNWLDELEAIGVREADAARSTQLATLSAQQARLTKAIATASAGQQATLRAQLDDVRNQINQIRNTQANRTGLHAYEGTLETVEEGAPTALARPKGTNRKMSLGIAGLIGLVAGLMIALVTEAVDTRIRRKEDAESHFGLPILGEIPKIRSVSSKPLVVRSRPVSPGAEAFRFLQTGLPRHLRAPGTAASSRVALAIGRYPRTIMVTSAGPAEGKTTVVANLAASMAELGNKVLVIDVDFHRPRLHRVFDIDAHTGLGNALQGDGPVVLEGYEKPSSIERITVVPSGSLGTWPIELLSSDRMRLALEQARDRYDVVLIDTPPLLLASEVSHLLPHVDAVLLVARAGRTRPGVAERTREFLELRGVAAAGVILNFAQEITLPRRRLLARWLVTPTPTPASNGGAASSNGHKPSRLRKNKRSKGGPEKLDEVRPASEAVGETVGTNES